MSPRLDIVDFHTHVLPGADHGSYSVSESEAQLDLAAEHGVKRIIATPHFYPNSHTVDGFLERRALAFEMLSSSLTESRPKLLLGAEVLLCEGLEKMASLDKLLISGTDTLLLELPFSGFSEGYIKSVKAIIKSGIDVVLAHVDRYDPENINKLLKIGAKAQVNASALCSFFRNKQLYEWLESGVIVAIGSDIHNRTRSAYDHFSKAIRKIGEYAERIKNSSDAIWDKAFLEK
ncbi:MAG: hypothetical protein IJE25_06385 [Clostridia bacterium]|nr:hypothetical protein [Clostridia bacterium]